MNAKEQIIANAIEGLRPRFMAAMAEHLDQLESAYDILVLNNQAQDALHESASRAHRVAGIAATFGWTEVGALARQSEDALNAQMASLDNEGSYLPILEALIEALSVALDA